MSKTREARRDFWRELIGQQQQSGLSVREFCRQDRTSEYSFYQWRKRLAQQVPVKFALVETGRDTSSDGCAMEVTLTSGERLRIGSGVDATTLRLVLSILREQR